MSANEPEESLAERCKARLERDERMQALSLEERAAMIPGVSGSRNGNGGNGNGDGQDK